MRSRLAIVLGFAALSTATLAQQQGFFRPTPDNDPSLTKPRPPAEAVAPAPAAPPRQVFRTPAAAAAAPDAAPAQAAASAPADTALMPPAIPPQVAQAQREMEQQMDRSVQEAQRDRTQLESPGPTLANTPAVLVPAPSTVNGAFDATTSERDR